MVSSTDARASRAPPQPGRPLLAWAHGRITVAIPAPAGIEKGPGPHRRRGQQKDIENLAVLRLETHGIDQHQAVDHLGAGDRHVCGQPATDVIAHQMCPFEPYSFQKPQIKQRHIGDVHDPGEPWGVAKPRMARRIDAKLLGQSLVMLQPARIALATVQEHQGRSFPTTIEVDIDACNGHRLFPPVRCRHVLLLGVLRLLSGPRQLAGAMSRTPYWASVLAIGES